MSLQDAYKLSHDFLLSLILAIPISVPDMTHALFVADNMNELFSLAGRRRFTAHAAPRQVTVLSWSPQCSDPSITTVRSAKASGVGIIHEVGRVR